MARVLILALVILIAGSTAFAELSFNGYYENTLAGVLKRDGQALGGDLNRLRLRLGYEFSENIRLQLEPEYNLFLKSADLPIAGVSNLDRLVFDRAFIKINFPQADLTVGRQRIAWGVGYLWNPTDVFNPFTLSFAVEEEEEAEPEAIRLEVPLGEAAGIDTYIVTNNKWEETKKGIRGRTNLGMFDLSASYVDLGSGGFQLGCDTVGELFDFGVRGEIAMISPANTDRYFQSVLGWNYSLENGWGLDAEYFLNGLGKRNKNDYDWDALISGEVSQLGMDYLYFGTNKTLDEISQVRFSILLNADDSSFLFYPTYSRNVLENLDMSLEALIHTGAEGTDFNPSASQDSSGFMSSNLALIRARYSF